MSAHGRRWRARRGTWGTATGRRAIDAASHVGNRPIAEFLIANGARPTIFTAVMMGQLVDREGLGRGDSRRAARRAGRTALTMVAHAQSRRARRAPHVLKYLESLGDADPRYTDLPLTEADHAAIAGEYVFGAGADRAVQGREERRGASASSVPGTLTATCSIRAGWSSTRPAPKPCGSDSSLVPIHRRMR